MRDERQGVWMMRQSWSPTLFVHWQVAPESVRPLVPRALELDTWQGCAFVSLVVVDIKRTRPRGLPPLPGSLAYQQLNLRTYVRHEESAGLYFFGAYVTKALPAVAQALGFGVPSRKVRMELRQGASDVRLRVEPHDDAKEGLSLHAVVDGEPRYAREGSLEAWLHERYRAFGLRGRTLLEADVRHRLWLLTPARVDQLSGGFDTAPIPLKDPSLVFLGAQAHTRLSLPHRVREPAPRRALRRRRGAARERPAGAV
jgi:uncharacterized protein YqjF (DUF2071 family)